MEPTSELALILRKQIEVDGPITFCEFMRQSLYHPQHGYYSSGRARLGRHGDFFTNVSVGPLFGTLLARQFEEMWCRLGQPQRFTIVEGGSHGGDFARDVLCALQSHAPSLFTTVRYCVVEPAIALREVQQKTLAAFLDKVSWVATEKELQPFRGVHFSNELLDALPVHELIWDGSEWRERHIVVGSDGFVFADGPISTALLREHAALLPTPVCAGACAEISLAALEWTDQLARNLESGYTLTIDYGFVRSELARLAERGGTLTGFFRHRREVNLLARPGEIDLTAHVDFSGVAARAEKRGFRVHGFTDQHHFMVGLSQAYFQDTVELTPRRAQEMRAFKTLMHPELMGRTFKVLCLEKDLPTAPPLLGFRFATDGRAALELI